MPTEPTTTQLPAGQLGHRHLGHAVSWTATAGAHNAGTRTGFDRLMSVRHTGDGVQLHGPDGTIHALLAADTLVTVDATGGLSTVEISAQRATRLLQPPMSPAVTKSMVMIDGRQAIYTDFTTATRFDATADRIREIRNAGWKLVHQDLWHEVDGTGIWRGVEPRQAAVG